MITIKEDTTLVGLSEFRTKADEIIKATKTHKVLIGKRNKPLAFLIDAEKFSQMEETLELLEDFALGMMAKERIGKGKISDYIDIEVALKRLKKK